MNLNDPKLEKLIVTIREDHKAIGGFNRNAIDRAAKCGDRLIEARNLFNGAEGKKKARKGWKAFVTDQIKIPYRSATRYMVIAANRDLWPTDRATLAQLGVAGLEAYISVALSIRDRIGAPREAELAASRKMLERAWATEKELHDAVNGLRTRDEVLTAFWNLLHDALYLPEPHNNAVLEYMRRKADEFLRVPVDEMEPEINDSAKKTGSEGHASTTKSSI